MKTAHDQGRLVLLQNLDPEYTSGEVQDIISCAFEENCTARMVQHTATSSPHSGQAFVIFKSREAVDRVVKKLDDECLMLPNQRRHTPEAYSVCRPLVVCTGVFPHFSEKRATFIGHLAIDKARRQVQREMKEAVSTSHYSQNNTIEYEMAMAWWLLQSKSDKWWEKLYEQQGKELKKLMGALKSK
ncbi:protein ANTI-SILENCING 1 [Sesamum angolense]|uniref:Protein ANTI-SILENCING 1 n=1 Tax=Sesamum angolense TaxID=2727404 RepID=A0AAE1W911_9LAMI|nr:protein ANTI-SILENCING 1 [Sesamum angolense]